MKKISFLALLVVAGMTLNAQRADFGIKGGLNLSSWSNNNDSRGYANRVGYHAGVFSQVHLSPFFAIQPEVVYSSQGTKYTDVANREHNLQLNYINIPVMAQVKVGGGLYAQAGPQIGFLMGVKDKVGDVETDFFTTDDFKKTDVALGFGLGFAGASPFGIDARYNLGLTNLNEGGGNNIKNNTLQIGLTYRLGGTMGSRY
jgi:hypothetical protein